MQKGTVSQQDGRLLQTTDVSFELSIDFGCIFERACFNGISHGIAPFAEKFRIMRIDSHGADQSFRDSECLLGLGDPGAVGLLFLNCLEAVFEDDSVGLVFHAVTVVFEADGGEGIAFVIAVEEGAVAVVGGP